MLSAPNRRPWATGSLALWLVLAACEPAHRDDLPGDRLLDAAAPLSQQGAADAAIAPGTAAPSPPGSRVLTVVKAGSRRGVVRASVGQLGCTGTSCLGAYPPGTRVTLTAEPYVGGAFSGWLGACAGIGPCTVDLTSDVTVTADFTGGPNLAFVTSQDTPGDFGGLAVADARCQATADRVGLPGRYVALLNDAQSTSPLDRLVGSRGWVRTDGKVVADTLDALRAQGPRHPVRLDERGIDQASDRYDVGATVLVWTGTNQSPEVRLAGAVLPGTPAYTCDGWNAVREGLAGGVGSGTASGGDFLALSSALCGLRARLFCFGVANQAEVVEAPQTGRLAFVTRTAWTPAGGVPAADAACQSEARAAGKAGTFRALLATPTSTAASRFDTRGARWVRADGAPLTVRGDSLQTEAIPFETPPMLDARGERVQRGYWLGATALRAPGTPASTCGNWSDARPTARGRAGQTSTSIAPYLAFGGIDASCDGTEGGEHGLLCLQE